MARIQAAGLPAAELVSAPHISTAGDDAAAAEAGEDEGGASSKPPSPAPEQPHHARPHPDPSRHERHPVQPQWQMPGGIWRHHEANQPQRDPTKLEKLGVNVDGVGGVYRAFAVPLFDESQWDHVHGGALAPARDASERVSRDTGLKVLKKAGVVVDASPLEEEGDDSGWLPKVPRAKTFVHTLFGFQTQLPYFADANDGDSEPKSREALLRAGVHIGPISWDGADHLVSGA